LLQLGHKFCLPTYVNKKFAVHEFIKDIECSLALRVTKTQLLIRNIATPLLHKFLNTTSSPSPVDIKIMHMHKMTKRFCADNPNIIFTRADKGNITVALKKEIYNNELENLLRDTKTYTVIEKDPVLSMEKKLNDLLKKWLRLGYITKQTLYKLRSSDSTLPKAYGLPKVHKKHTPFRLIISSVNTALYPLASYLQEIISNSLESNNTSIMNSFECYNLLSERIINDNDVLISLDVISLFTNVPLNLALEGLQKRWTLIESKTNIPKNEFLSAVDLIFSSNFFTFNKVIYKQIFGTPMGSPLSPVIADIVMRDLEITCLHKLNFNLTFYHRYVDDIILTSPPDKLDIILNTFNSYHERLHFTIELEENRSLSFLDLRLTISDNTIYIDWFQKNSFSGRFLSFHSNHPLCHKIGTIYSLVDRAFLLSHPKFHQKNISLVIDLLIENGFPLNLIFRKINERLKFLIHKCQGITRGNSVNSYNVHTDTDKKIVVFPYIKKISESIADKIDNSKYVKGYRTLNNLSNFIKVHKDINSHDTNNNVVYKICCRDCDASYVGQTKRQLRTRIREHINNTNSTKSNLSVITEHIRDNLHSFDWNNITILDHEPNYYKRLISEMLYIKEQTNGLNSQIDTDLLDNCYSDILSTLTNL